MPRGLLCFGALTLGILRKSGFPQFNIKYYEDRIFRDENFWMITFLPVAALADWFGFVIYFPIIVYGALVLARISADTSHATKMYVNIINCFKSLL